MSIAVFEHINQINRWVLAQRAQGFTVGFVPTMGALHAGHQSLIELALSQCDRVVASVFVNPTQFNNANDLLKYPRTLDADLQLLDAAGCHAVFCPEVSEMYGAKEQSRHWDYGALSNSLEGLFRPGHFDGVLTIVKKLLLAVVPSKAFFGEKDFQQLALIHRMSVDEGLAVEVVAAPTIRETNGLAMSSRNMRLSSGERETALAISQTLFFAASEGRNVLPRDLEQRANEMLASVGELKVEYCALVNAISFEPLHDWPSGKSVLLVAAFVGDVRLIDNVIIP